MGLTVGEIRDRAERFRASVLEEVYEARAGRKSWPELASLHEAQGILKFDRIIPIIERDLAASDGDDERRLRRLRQWAADHHLRSANARLDDEYALWVSTATVPVDGSELPIRQANAIIEATGDRNVRRRFDDARNAVLEEGAALQLERLSRWRAAAEELGYGDYREAAERLAGLSLTGLQRQARRLVVETEDVYREHLGWLLRSRLGVGTEDAEGHDADWLTRMKWLDGSWDETSLLRLVTRDLTDIGLPLAIAGRVNVEHETFPGPGMQAFCAPIVVPDRINLLVTPTATQPGCTALLAEIGKALHWAYTDPRLPFEYRAVGDLAVVEAHGAIFAGLARSRPWSRRVRGFGAEELSDYLRLVAFVDLYWLRKAAARLQFDLELAASDRPESMGPRWAELVREATGFRVDPRGCFEQLGQRFGVARWIRARMLAAQIRRVLRDRFDDDWYRNPRTGPFLGDWFAEGLRWNAAELAGRVGADRLGADELLSSVREGLA